MCWSCCSKLSNRPHQLSMPLMAQDVEQGTHGLPIKNKQILEHGWNTASIGPALIHCITVMARPLQTIPKLLL